MRLWSAGALALLALASGLAALAHLQAEGGVEWLLHVDDYDNPLGKPVLIRVWAYDPANLVNYTVTCNITAINATSVVFMDSFSGAPAEYTFTRWVPDALDVSLTCEADNGDVTRYTFTVSFHYPAITVTPLSVSWARPFDLQVTAEYPYNLPVLVTIGDATYNTSFSDGIAVIPDLVLYEDVTVAVSFLGQTTTHDITVEPPTLLVNATPTTVKLREPVNLTAILVDEYGPVPAPHNITYSVGGCASYEAVHPAGTTITIVPDTPGTCVFKANTTVAGVELEATASFTVLPAILTNATLTLTEINKWRYIVLAYVEADTPANGTLAIYVDGELVAENTSVATEWSIRRVIELAPGLHEVRAVFTSNETNATWCDRVELNVPKYPSTVDVPATLVIPFGADIDDYIPDDYVYYVVGVAPGEYTLYVYNPGDDLHAPAAKLVSVTVKYPSVVVEEDGDSAVLRVTGAYPGSKIFVYGVKPGGERVLLYEAVIRGTTHEATIPGFGSGYFIAVYSYNGRNLTFIANEPEPVEYTTACLAGVPCVPVAPSQWISEVYIGGEYYEPGTEVMLPAGEYKVVIVQVDGSVVNYTLTVEKPRVAVLVDAGDPTRASVQAPPGVEVILVLESGRTLAVAAGDYTLPEPVVNAYSPYFPVELVRVARVP